MKYKRGISCFCLTRIPRVQLMVRDFFDDKPINPDEAAVISDDEDPCQVILLNINPDTLGIETVLIPRSSRVQTSKSKIVTTYHWQYQDNQEQVF